MSYRSVRLAEEIKRVITDLMRTALRDPRISGMTSITGVDVSKDLRYAKIYISVLGTEEEQEKTIEGLQSAGGFIRSEMGKAIRLRYTPELSFTLDTSIQHSLKINKMLRDIIPDQDKELKD